MKSRKEICFKSKAKGGEGGHTTDRPGKPHKLRYSRALIIAGAYFDGVQEKGTSVATGHTQHSTLLLLLFTDLN